MTELMPHEPEVLGLRALMLLQHSRRHARVDARGESVLLRDQDRSLWDTAAISEGLTILGRARRIGRDGQYLLQAEIAAQHAMADSTETTDRHRIVELYDRLVEVHPAPVVRLNRAVAVSEALGAEAGLAALVDLESELAGYHAYHLARSEMLRELGDEAGSRIALARALELAPNEIQRRFLEARLRRRLDETA